MFFSKRKKFFLLGAFVGMMFLFFSPQASATPKDSILTHPDASDSPTPTDVNGVTNYILNFAAKVDDDVPDLSVKAVFEIYSVITNTTTGEETKGVLIATLNGTEVLSVNSEDASLWRESTAQFNIGATIPEDGVKYFFLVKVVDNQGGVSPHQLQYFLRLGISSGISFIIPSPAAASMEVVEDLVNSKIVNFHVGLNNPDTEWGGLEGFAVEKSVDGGSVWTNVFYNDKLSNYYHFPQSSGKDPYLKNFICTKSYQCYVTASKPTTISNSAASSTKFRIRIYYTVTSTGTKVYGPPIDVDPIPSFSINAPQETSIFPEQSGANILKLKIAYQYQDIIGKFLDYKKLSSYGYNTGNPNVTDFSQIQYKKASETEWQNIARIGYYNVGSANTYSVSPTNTVLGDIPSGLDAYTSPYGEIFYKNSGYVNAKPGDFEYLDADPGTTYDIRAKTINWHVGYGDPNAESAWTSGQITTPAFGEINDSNITVESRAAGASLKWIYDRNYAPEDSQDHTRFEVEKAEVSAEQDPAMITNWTVLNNKYICITNATQNQCSIDAIGLDSQKVYYFRFRTVTTDNSQPWHYSGPAHPTMPTPVDAALEIFNQDYSGSTARKYIAIHFALKTAADWGSATNFEVQRSEDGGNTWTAIATGAKTADASSFRGNGYYTFPNSGNKDPYLRDPENPENYYNCATAQTCYLSVSSGGLDDFVYISSSSTKFRVRIYAIDSSTGTKNYGPPIDVRPAPSFSINAPQETSIFSEQSGTNLLKLKLTYEYQTEIGNLTGFRFPTTYTGSGYNVGNPNTSDFSQIQYKKASEGDDKWQNIARIGQSSAHATRFVFNIRSGDYILGDNTGADILGTVYREIFYTTSLAKSSLFDYINVDPGTTYDIRAKTINWHVTFGDSNAESAWTFGQITTPAVGEINDSNIIAEAKNAGASLNWTYDRSYTTEDPQDHTRFEVELAEFDSEQPNISSISDASWLSKKLWSKNDYICTTNASNNSCSIGSLSGLDYQKVYYFRLRPVTTNNSQPWHYSVPVHPTTAALADAAVEIYADSGSEKILRIYYALASPNDWGGLEGAVIQKNTTGGTGNWSDVLKIDRDSKSFFITSKPSDFPHLSFNNYNCLTSYTCYLFGQDKLTQDFLKISKSLDSSTKFRIMLYTTRLNGTTMIYGPPIDVRLAPSLAINAPQEVSIFSDYSGINLLKPKITYQYQADPIVKIIGHGTYGYNVGNPNLTDFSQIQYKKSSETEWQNIGHMEYVRVFTDPYVGGTPPKPYNDPSAASDNILGNKEYEIHIPNAMVDSGMQYINADPGTIYDIRAKTINWHVGYTDPNAESAWTSGQITTPAVGNIEACNSSVPSWNLSALPNNITLRWKYKETFAAGDIQNKTRFEIQWGIFSYIDDAGIDVTKDDRWATYTNAFVCTTSATNDICEKTGISGLPVADPAKDERYYFRFRPKTSDNSLEWSYLGCTNLLKIPEIIDLPINPPLAYIEAGCGDAAGKKYCRQPLKSDLCLPGNSIIDFKLQGSKWTWTCRNTDPNTKLIKESGICWAVKDCSWTEANP